MFCLLYYFIIPAYIRCYMFDFDVLVHSVESSVEIPFFICIITFKRMSQIILCVKSQYYKEFFFSFYTRVKFY